MHNLKKYLLLIVITFSPLHSQDENIDKYVSSYSVNSNEISKFRVIYSKILVRREAFHYAITDYKKSGKDIDSFYYDWSIDVEEIKKSLSSENVQFIRNALFMSYLDLGYGLYGLKLDSSLVNDALDEIKPTSSLWAIEPSLLEAALRYSGQPQKYDIYVLGVIENNPDSVVRRYAAMNLSPDRKIKPGNAVLLFSLKYIDDSTLIISPEKLHGKYYLIDFWATWCVPCIEEMERLHKVYSKYKNKGFEIISISLDDDPEKISKFRNGKWPMPWLNSIANSENNILKEFEITEIPNTILVSDSGIILKTGYDLRARNLEHTLEKIFQ